MLRSNSTSHACGGRSASRRVECPGREETRFARSTRSFPLRKALAVRWTRGAATARGSGSRSACTRRRCACRRAARRRERDVRGRLQTMSGASNSRVRHLRSRAAARGIHQAPGVSLWRNVLPAIQPPERRGRDSNPRTTNPPLTVFEIWLRRLSHAALRCCATPCATPGRIRGLIPCDRVSGRELRELLAPRRDERAGGLGGGQVPCHGGHERVLLERVEQDIGAGGYGGGARDIVE